MTASEIFVWVRLVVNLTAAGGCLVVVWRTHGTKGAQVRYLMGLLLAMAIYNAGAGIWFAATTFNWVSPSSFWRSHTYTLLNGLESVAAILFALHLEGHLE